MKIVVISGDGRNLGEVKLSQELLRRSDMLVERLTTVIRASLQEQRVQDNPLVDDRLVEGSPKGVMQRMDDDCSVMDVPLNLNEACHLSFDKHIDAIESDERRAAHRNLRHTVDDERSRRIRASNTLHREHPAGRTRIK